MQPTEYIAQAKRTDLPEYLTMEERMLNLPHLRLLHAAMGITTEAGEFMDAFKKHFLYGKQLDVINLKEELGDILWYIAIAADELGISFESIMQTNIDKLKKRFPEKFTEHNAINRDLESERKILEN